jgi:hypothetical protein
MKSLSLTYNLLKLVRTISLLSAILLFNLLGLCLGPLISAPNVPPVIDLRPHHAIVCRFSVYIPMAKLVY